MLSNTRILEDLQTVFDDVFFEDPPKVTENLTAADVERWDSLTNIELIVAVEKKFEVRFTTAEIQALKSAGDLARLIGEKR